MFKVKQCESKCKTELRHITEMLSMIIKDFLLNCCINAHCMAKWLETEVYVSYV